MIVPMKKAIIVALAKDAKITVETLCSLGILHVEHEGPPQGKEISELREDIALIDATVATLSGKEFLENSVVNKPQGLKDWRSTAKHIVDLRKRLEQLSDYSYSLTSQIDQWQEWGDFEPKDIEELAKKNIHLRLCQIPVKEIKNLPVGAKTKILKIKGGIANCVVIWQGKIEVPYKEIVLPKTSLSNMQERLSEDKKAVQSIKEGLLRFTVYYNDFLEIKYSLIKELEFQAALKGMGETGGLVYLKGYLPYDVVSRLAETAKKERWGVLIKDPSEEDNVPTLIRNPRWISIVSPIFKFLEIFPGYREWDISPVFIVFFSLFFGMLIGDAGYGLVYMFLTFLAQKKTGAKIKDKSVFALFYLLSFCAVIWGLLTGTFFGQEWFLKAGYKPLIPALNNPNRIQTFCFFVGALHLTIAHIWRAIIKLPSCASLADVGWIGVVWSVFLLAKMLILGEGFPSFGVWLISAGISLIVLFNNPQKNILKILNTDLITLALGLISSFGEVVSYIRLFAVGMAGVAIADGFNAMAARIGTGSMVALIGSVFVAMLGHLLCLVLGPLSVLVHGIRLNLLEFSGHANISWSGSAYKPLKE